MGGIPQYLKMVDTSKSVRLNIEKLCFAPNGYLVNEFERLFASHFGKNRRYRDILLSLARNGWASRDRLRHDCRIGSGGRISEYLENLELAVATTSKIRRARVEYLKAEALPGFLEGKGSSVQSAGIVFGREESGLSNDEIRLCDVVSSIPLTQPYPSLNLGQAVMIFAYTLSGYAIRSSSSEDSGDRDQEGFRAMMDNARQVLDRMGLQDNPALYNRMLERLASLKEDDIHLLHSLLKRFQD